MHIRLYIILVKLIVTNVTDYGFVCVGTMYKTILTIISTQLSKKDKIGLVAPTQSPSAPILSMAMLCRGF